MALTSLKILSSMATNMMQKQSTSPRIVVTAIVSSVTTLGLLLTYASPSHPRSTVKIRSFWHVINSICKTMGLVQVVPGKQHLLDLHEEVIKAEQEAFHDTPSQEDGKRKLFNLQLDGVDGPGNLFTPLGRFIFGKDMVLRLKRRLR